ncbi:MAG: hypothetical protein AAFO15_00375 [Pseudomonadota bacterium]
MEKGVKCSNDGNLNLQGGNFHEGNMLPYISDNISFLGGLFDCGMHADALSSLGVSDGNRSLYDKDNFKQSDYMSVAVKGVSMATVFDKRWEYSKCSHDKTDILSNILFQNFNKKDNLYSVVMVDSSVEYQIGKWSKVMVGMYFKCREYDTLCVEMYFTYGESYSDRKKQQVWYNFEECKVVAYGIDLSKREITNAEILDAIADELGIDYIRKSDGFLQEVNKSKSMLCYNFRYDKNGYVKDIVNVVYGPDVDLESSDSNVSSQIIFNHDIVVDEGCLVNDNWYKG